MMAIRGEGASFPTDRHRCGRSRLRAGERRRKARLPPADPPPPPPSKAAAAPARPRGFGVTLHVPMEPEGPATDRTESFLLRRGMTTAEIAERFARMAADIPQANGASNHMGSAFTSDPAAMAAFAQALKGKGFFFVDSVTSSGTVGLRAAGEAGVPATRRDVFLDDDGRPQEMGGRGGGASALAKER